MSPHVLRLSQLLPWDKVTLDGTAAVVPLPDPLPRLSWQPSATEQMIEAHARIESVVLEQRKKIDHVIETVCWASLETGHGVLVTIGDGYVLVGIDPSVPWAQIHYTSR